MMNQTGANDANLDARLRVMRILWMAFLLTVGLYVLVTVFARPSQDALDTGNRNNPTLLIGLAVIGFSTFVASFVIKRVFYKKATEQSDPAQFQTGFIIALALCESCVLFGLVGLFITWNVYAYALFILGALGIALHFPRRDELAAAYFKSW
jgi:F0F1-type ATP synthase membrane subunit c/vacuolar-type H+-ATPase subunit K